MNFMEEKLYYVIDKDGFYVEPTFAFNTSENLIETPLPDGMHKPRWNGVSWEDAEPEKADGGAAVRYMHYRKRAYPPIEEFIDALVKGDEEQKQAYINTCLEVKSRFPKDADYAPLGPIDG